MKPACILVIESDEASAVEKAAALDEAGYEVVRGIDILDGLRKLHEACPDLIIVDGELPVVNGEDPCLRIRRASYLPIIVIGSAEYAAETLESGADAYVVKPASPVELVARVHALLRRKTRYDLAADNPKLEINNRSPKGGNGSKGPT